MSYSDLHTEAFDHDLAHVAVQAAAVLPAGDSLEDRPRYYRDRDENTQHHFFTQVSVQEWEACGDWFLEQFAAIMQGIHNQHQAKRKIVANLEDVIAEREKTVRVKVESIERTLDELKHESEGMMKGRDMNL